jgi:autotransporter-associated beta strand protein
LEVDEMSDARARRRSRAFFSALTPLVIVASARAGATFSASSTATIIHNADDVNGHGGSGDKHVNPPPSSASMPSYQYAGTLTYQSASTLADASVGAVTTSTITGFTLAPGTGVQQTDPENILHSSELVIDVDGIWNVSGSQGPTATGYLSFTLAGTVGAGGSAAWSVDLNFTNASNVALRPAIVAGGSFSPGAFSYPYTSDVAFSPTALANGSQVNITGSITLTADADDPTSIAMPDFEVSNAPPTSRFVGTGTGSVDFNNPSNWSSAYVDPSTDITQTVPNGVGLRAVFVGSGGTATNVTLSQPTTLGTLDIDEPGINIVASNTASLTFQTDPEGADHACLLIRNVQGAGTHSISGAIVLAQTLETENDSSGTLVLGGAAGNISGQGGLVVNGLGSLSLDGSNSFTGGVTVNSGAVYANAAGALGNGTVAVSGGLLNYNANGAAPAGTVVTVNSGGQVALGVVPTSDRFSVNNSGCISGSGAELAGLQVGTNLTLASGAMIGHQTFDTGSANNPTGLGTTPQYIFGISNDFISTTQANGVTIGSASSSPWSGFGGDGNVRTFGSGTSSTLQSLIIAGNAQLMSLGSELIMNGAISGGGGTLTKQGAGLVSINSTVNTYTGAAVVQSGPLAVNGIFNPSSLTIQSGATLAGAGTIGSSVIVNNSAHLSPGTLGQTPSFATSPFQQDTPGTLTTGGLTLSGDSQLDFQFSLTGVVGGPTNDLVVVNGNLVLAGVLNITDGGQFSSLGTYTLFQYTGTATDNGVTLGNTPDLDKSEQVQIVPNDGGGGSVVLEPAVAPEPSSLSALFVTGFLMSCRRRRRNR